MTLLHRAKRKGKQFQNPVPTTIGNPSLLFKILPLYLSNKAERTPKRQLGPFRTDPKTYATPPEGGLRVTWMGHASMLIEMDGLRVLADPMWNQRAAPVEWAGPKRFFPPTLRLAELPPIDVVLISHDHYDHLGGYTVSSMANLAATANARWVTPLGVGKILHGFGVNPTNVTELDWTDTLRVGTLELTALPSRHFSGRSLLNRFETLWASFLLATDRHRVYYGADSGEWPGFAEIGRAYGPFDLTMLEIGAFHPLWADIHMGPDGAARSFEAMGGHGLLMPIHWGLFDLALHAWRQPIESISAIEGLKLWSPSPGAPTEVVPGAEVRSEWWR
jgi:L-ascorbate metabolism protein UlaG (beta-lactamase superfamily)